MGLLGGLPRDAVPWFDALVKPSWQPPRYLFGPVWAGVSALNAASLGLGLWAAGAIHQTLFVATLAAGNALLGFAWTPLFFHLRRPDWALADACLLCVFAWAYVLTLMPISGLASMLALPYAIWVTFAAVLNRSIVRLNGSFGQRP